MLEGSCGSSSSSPSLSLYVSQPLSPPLSAHSHTRRFVASCVCSLDLSRPLSVRTYLALHLSRPSPHHDGPPSLPSLRSHTSTSPTSAGSDARPTLLTVAPLTATSAHPQAATWQASRWRTLHPWLLPSKAHNRTTPTRARSLHPRRLPCKPKQSVTLPACSNTTTTCLLV